MAFQIGGQVAKYLYEDVQNRRERERQSLINAVGSDTYNLSLYRHNNIIVPQNNIYIQYNDNRQYKDNRSSVNWKTVVTTVFICTTLYLVFSSRHEIVEVIFETVLPAIASLPRLAWSCVIWVYCGISGGIGLGLRAFVAGCSFGWTCLIVSVSYVWQGSIWACLAIRNLSSIVCRSAWTAVYGTWWLFCTLWTYAVSRAIWHTWEGIWYIGFGLTVGYFASRFLVSGS